MKRLPSRGWQIVLAWGWGWYLGGALIGTTGNYRALFVIDGISFVVFFGVVYAAIAETRKFDEHHSKQASQGWAVALRDRQSYGLCSGQYPVHNLSGSGTTARCHCILTNFVSGGTSKGGFSPRRLVACLPGILSLRRCVSCLLPAP
jgi:hypothetical protein